MIKYKACKKCGHNKEVEFLCDTCGKEMLKGCQGIPITVEFSYGHPLDGETYHFCSNSCAAQFLQEEEAKLTSRNNIEFGHGSMGCTGNMGHGIFNVKKERK